MTSLDSVSMFPVMETKQRVAFEDRNSLYEPLIAERMKQPMPAHLQGRYDALKTPAQRAKFNKARADGIRMKIHDEHVRAGFWS